MNPVHFDEEYARKTIFRGRVAHGALSIGYIMRRASAPRCRAPARSSCRRPSSSRCRCGSAIPSSPPSPCARSMAARRVHGLRLHRGRQAGAGIRSPCAGAAPARQGLTGPDEDFPSLRRSAGSLRGAVVAIGNFDGVHLGHQALIAEARAQAQARRRAAGGAGVRAASAGIFPPVARLLPPDALAPEGAAAGGPGRGCAVRADLRCRDGSGARRRNLSRQCW